ncbi:MAG: flavin reductase family protein [Cyclobacteriaceae bacterium]|nr:flavin reductase [Cytophagales bacterium]HNP77474.1 flavin reductase family protein [Cyclobacteriaceae bacterium]
MVTIDPKDIPLGRMHSYLQSTVIPRPIAFASTVDDQGHPNLSPFSFYNTFGSHPPTLVFSPSRRVRDNTTKHTLHNVLSVPEVVIHVVSYAMVEQASLASCEYPQGVNEFIKAGFTEVPSTKVRPPRIAEAPIAMECVVRQVVELGKEGGAGNLVVCEVVLMHIREEVLDGDGKIDPMKLDAVARLGGDQYLRMIPGSIFTVPKPNDKLGIGFDRLPAEIRNSDVLTGNDLARLANIEVLPSAESVLMFSQHKDVQSAIAGGESAVHRFAKALLEQGRVADAWRVLLVNSAN